MFTVHHYLTVDERDIFKEWLKTVRDPLVKLQVARRVNRVESSKATSATTGSAVTACGN